MSDKQDNKPNPAPVTREEFETLVTCLELIHKELQRVKTPTLALTKSIDQSLASLKQKASSAGGSGDGCIDAVKSAPVLNRKETERSPSQCEPSTQAAQPFMSEQVSIGEVCRLLRGRNHDKAADDLRGVYERHYTRKERGNAPQNTRSPNPDEQAPEVANELEAGDG